MHRVFRAAVLMFGLHLLQAAAAEGDRNRDLLMQYPTGTIAELLAPPPDGRAITLEALRRLPGGSAMTLESAPQDVLYYGIRLRRVPVSAKVVVTYSGQRRRTDKLLVDAIEAWGALATSQSGVGHLYASELAFLESGKTHWIPVSAFALNRESASFQSKDSHILALNAVGWTPDGRPILVASYGALAGAEGVPGSPHSSQVEPIAEKRPGANQRFDPAHFRLVPFGQLREAPTGGIISNSPVQGLREDQVRAKAIYLRRSRPTTKTDTRLLDTWIRARGYKSEISGAFSHEYEFMDAGQRFWLPVFSLSALTLLTAKPGAEVELYVHRFDAPYASAELLGPEAVVMGVLLTKPAEPVSANDATQTIFQRGRLSFNFQGRHHDLALNPEKHSLYVDNRAVGGSVWISLKFGDAPTGTGVIELIGLQGPGKYTPDNVVIFDKDMSRSRTNARSSDACTAVVVKLSNAEIQGRIECPSNSLQRPTEIEFSAGMR